MSGKALVFRNTIFKRLILTFILVLSAIYIIGTGIYNLGIRTVKNQILLSMQDQVQFKMNGLESDIKLVRNMMNDLTQDEIIRDITINADALSDYKKTMSILSVLRRIQSIKNSSLTVNDLGVCLPALGRTVYASGKIDSVDKSFLDILNRKYLKYESRLINIDNKQFVVARYPYISIDMDKEPLFLIFAEFSADKIKDLLKGFDVSGTGRFILNDYDQQYIITNEEDKSTRTKIEALMKNVKRTDMGKVMTENIAGRRYLIIYCISDDIDLRLSAFVPEDVVFKPLRIYRYGFWIFTAIAFLVIFIYSVSTYKFIHRPMGALVNAFKSLEIGDMNVKLVHLSKNEFTYLYKQFNTTVEKLRELIDQVYKQKILMQSAQLKQLQSQINPHFLYNSFFILENMAEDKDYENVTRFTRLLGNYFQYITRNAQDEALLEKEVSHAHTYADIQCRRFSRRISAEFEELPEDCGSIHVPRLILQPILENSFEHGLKDKLQDGCIRVWFKKNEKFVGIYIEDNGEDLSCESLKKLQDDLQSQVWDGESTGILNIHRRLMLKFGVDSGISVSRGLMGGLKVEVKIPLLEE